MMRETIAGRIEMLHEGVTFYDEEKKAHYLQEYESKLQDLDRQILSLSLEMIEPTEGKQR